MSACDNQSQRRGSNCYIELPTIDVLIAYVMSFDGTIQCDWACTRHPFKRNFGEASGRQYEKPSSCDAVKFYGRVMYLGLDGISLANKYWTFATSLVDKNTRASASIFS
jgi:hypothetical protein